MIQSFDPEKREISEMDEMRLRKDKKIVSTVRKPR